VNIEERLNDILEGEIPEHVAIIPDGNGRWAHNRGLERTEGHRQGTKRAEDLIEFISEKLPIKYLTFYTFSTENWSRPESEPLWSRRLMIDPSPCYAITRQRWSALSWRMTASI